MNSKSDHRQEKGYYFVRIHGDTSNFLSSNGERSFVISQLQDLFTFHPYGYSSNLSYPTSIALQSDLLAFSITRDAISLLLFCSSLTALSTLKRSLAEGLAWYSNEYHPQKNTSRHLRYTTKKLYGPHQALEYTATIHLLHEDWEYDRYSSIGFYLHDRRGSWMRLWRMSGLFENHAQKYYEFLVSKQKEFRASSVATSLHE